MTDLPQDIQNVKDEIDLIHNPGLTADDLKWLRAGFIDAMERRDVPLDGLTPEQLKRWREGLRDGAKWSRRYAQAYDEWLHPTEETLLARVKERLMNRIHTFPKP